MGNGLWLPPFSEADYSGLVPYPNTGADNTATGPTSPGGQLENWVIPSTDSNIYNHASLQFFFEDTTVTPPLYYGRITDATSPTWYRNVRPWTIDIEHVISQRANVTILNNVINPDKGQKTSLYYTLPNSGLVTIMVFDLAGDVVSILYHGQLAGGRPFDHLERHESAGAGGGARDILHPRRGGRHRRVSESARGAVESGRSGTKPTARSRRQGADGTLPEAKKEPPDWAAQLRSTVRVSMIAAHGVPIWPGPPQLKDFHDFLCVICRFYVRENLQNFSTLIDDEG